MADLGISAADLVGDDLKLLHEQELFDVGLLPASVLFQISNHDDLRLSEPPTRSLPLL